MPISVSTNKRGKNNNSNNEIEVDRASLNDVGRASQKDVPKKWYISPKERQQIIDGLRLV